MRFHDSGKPISSRIGAERDGLGRICETKQARAALLLLDDVDTDQIIPARFLTTTVRSGLGAHLFADWRLDAAGAPRPDFALNRPESRGAGILVTGRNFGCGSSREHAPWALRDFGFRVILAQSFADIFSANALKNGLLPVVLGDAAHSRLVDQLGSAPEGTITVDLTREAVTLADGEEYVFAIDPFARRCLLDGMDQLAFLLSAEGEIAEYERTHQPLVQTT
jgi:3-isopropylmalate/(R)-2-methylmalate dehydratase small subunit